MKNYILIAIAAIGLLLFSNLSFSQTINLRVLTSFIGSSGQVGAFNEAGSIWAGDVGKTNGSFDCNVYNAEEVTAIVREDLMRLYVHLNDLFVDFSGTHTSTFDSEPINLLGLHCLPGACSLGSEISLDG